MSSDPVSTCRRVAARAGPRKTSRERNIKNQRQVRPAPAERQVVHGLHELRRNAARIALVHGSRVRKPITNHDRAQRKLRLDNVAHMLRAARPEHQQLSLGTDRAGPGKVLDQSPQLLAQRRPARLARGADRVPRTTQR